MRALRLVLSAAALLLAPGLLPSCLAAPAPATASSNTSGSTDAEDGPAPRADIGGGAGTAVLASSPGPALRQGTVEAVNGRVVADGNPNISTDDPNPRWKSNEFPRGSGRDRCRDVILFIARGSDQPGNIGNQPGPALSQGLKLELGEDKVATQGIDYPATRPANLRLQGTNPEYATQFTLQIIHAAFQCPGSAILLMGYSQGATMCHWAVRGMSAKLQRRVTGLVMFGDPEQVPEGGRVTGTFDPRNQKTLQICQEGDWVCRSGILKTGKHHDRYNRFWQQAVRFYLKMLDGRTRAAAAAAQAQAATAVGSPAAE